MNMDKGLKTELEEPYGFFASLPHVGRCGKCGKIVFQRLKIRGRLVNVHGDNSYCMERGNER